MKFHVFVPQQALGQPAAKFPALYFLSGLTCTDENFITKSGIHRFAAEAGLIVVAPDTSPRAFGLLSDLPVFAEHKNFQEVSIILTSPKIGTLVCLKDAQSRP